MSFWLLLLLLPVVVLCRSLEAQVAGEVIVQTSPSTAVITHTIFGFPQDTVDLRGDVTTQAIGQPDGTFQTEILSMSLTGSSPIFGPVVVRENPARSSTGIMRGPLPGSAEWIYSDSSFNVFVEIDIPQRNDLQLANPIPVGIRGVDIPVLHRLRFQFATPAGVDVNVPLIDRRTGQQMGVINRVVHIVDPPPPCFKRGDADCDGCVDDDDARYINEYLFNNGPAPCCFDAADTNDDGIVNLTDATYLLNYLHTGGPAPPPPGPDLCGVDPTDDSLPPCDYPKALCDVRCPVACYPPAGVDCMDSVLLHDIDIPGIGLCRGNLRGPVKVRRSDPRVDPATGLQCIDTEIIDLLLTGVDPACGRICITLNPFRPSLGQIKEKVAGTCFPANSWFNVFVKVELKDLGLCFYACDPAMMHCMINQIPPYRCLYNLDIGQGQRVPLYRGPCDPAVGGDPCAVQPLPPPAAFIVKAVHIPQPPADCECFTEGEDVLFTTLIHQIELPGIGIQCSSFTGPIVVRRGAPVLTADGICCQPTEIIRMEMQGTCLDGSPATIRLCPNRRSLGQICAKQRGACFPANSCFDIFFEVEVQMPTGPMTFKNCRPATMCCMIDRLPPLGCSYAIQNPPIELYKVVPGEVSPCLQSPLPPPDGFIRQAVHRPEEIVPPCCPEYGPGEDVFQSSLLHDIDIPGLGLRCSANLFGPARVRRGQTYIDPATGLCKVDVEMVDLQLMGVDPVCGRICITLDPRRPSRGQICQKERGACFPANSCFDMFVRIELKDLGLVLVACRPARMCCMIDGIPPIGCLYQIDLGPDGRPVELYREVATANVCDLVPRPNPTAFIIRAVHQPEPPCPPDVPPAGVDTLESDAQIQICVSGLGPRPGEDLMINADLAGQVVVQRGEPMLDPMTGRCTIETEILQLDLRGAAPIYGPQGEFVAYAPGAVRLQPGQRSLGQVVTPSPQEDPAGLIWPDFFDVFVEVEWVFQGQVILLQNRAPIRVQAVLAEGQRFTIPPLDIPFKLLLSPVPLFRPGATQAAGLIKQVCHTPRRPCDNCPEYGPGIDRMDSTLSHDIEIFGVADKVCRAPLSGIVEVWRGQPYTTVDPVTGAVVCCVPTRITNLDLRGVDPACGPVRISLCPDRPSRGTICQKQPPACFPAQSCFDVFIQVEVMGMVLKNCVPARMCCMIDRLPPFGCVYQIDLGTQVLLFAPGECDDPTTRALGRIVAAQHVPVPCPVQELTCRVVDSATGPTVVLSWTLPPPPCPPCERIVVRRTNPDGTETVVTLPAGTTTVTDPLQGVSCPPGAGAIALTYCVECVNAGVASRPVCCDVSIPCPRCEVSGVACQVNVAGQVVITWNVSDPDCCSRFLILKDGVVIGTVPATVRTFQAPCMPGTYCVQCVDPSGQPRPINAATQCCTVRPEECCPPDGIASVDCDPVVGPAGPTVVVSWTLVAGLPPECCRQIVVTLNGAQVAVVPAVQGSVTLPCQPGTYCVQCVLPDGNLGPRHCCDVSADQCRTGGGQIPGDCNQDGTIDLSDAICVFRILFLGTSRPPCNAGVLEHPANIALLDWNGDGRVDISDGISVLQFLFGPGRPHVLGQRCIPIPDCPRVCDPTP